MKKIMFNDKYRLTQAVLEGRKTQTRRIAYDFRKHTSNKVTKCVILPSGSITYMDGEIQVLDDMPQPAYKVGDEVAVAQRYKEVADIDHNFCFPSTRGFFNKMFVRADLMPHRIRITNIRVERLQDISDEDCLREGIERCGTPTCHEGYCNRDCDDCATSPREAFAILIDKTCGKGTWDSNPFVAVYDFELVK